MKRLLTTLVVLISFNVRSQSIVDSLSSLTFSLTDTVSDKLADLVIEGNVNLNVADKEVEASKFGWKQAKSFWGSNLTASFNLNEGNLRSAKDSALANLFYPRYNLNLAVPLSTFFSKPKEAKKAKAEYEATIAQRDLQKHQLRANIKTAYQIYITNKYLLSLQEAVLRDEKLLLSQVQKAFETSVDVSMEAFVNANKRYNAELAKRLQLMKDVNLAKADLENYLGMKLEDALRALGISNH
jgi:outer membrane protein TolC